MGKKKKKDRHRHLTPDEMRRAAAIDAQIEKVSADLRIKYGELLKLSGIDPAVLDSISDKQLASKSSHYISFALEKSGIDPVFCYAVRKTGHVVSDRTHHPADVVKEWDAAFAEGKALIVKDGGHRRG